MVLHTSTHHIDIYTHIIGNELCHDVVMTKKVS